MSPPAFCQALLYTCIIPNHLPLCHPCCYCCSFFKSNETLTCINLTGVTYCLVAASCSHYLLRQTRPVFNGTPCLFPKVRQPVARLFHVWLLFYKEVWKCVKFVEPCQCLCRCLAFCSCWFEQTVFTFYQSISLQNIRKARHDHRKCSQFTLKNST